MASRILSQGRLALFVSCVVLRVWHIGAVATTTRAPPEPAQSTWLREGMQFRRLGDSDLVVSKACLGTSTFGGQVKEKEAILQLNAAFDEYNVNFLDTSELYPIPAERDTSGAADGIVSRWLRTRSRDEVVISAKIAGRSPNIDWLRSGVGTSGSPAHITEAVEAALGRLDCDHIDLLQLEWPDRHTPVEMSNGYDENMDDAETVAIAEQLQTFKDLIDQGKVRHIGLSNETPFGVAKCLELAEREGLPKIVSVQNAYSLVERNAFETGLYEICHHGGVDLLAHSPMAGGALTGKYTSPRASAGARMSVFPGFTARYLLTSTQEAIEEYRRVADQYGLTLAQLALSWCYSRPFVASTIIGCTSEEQVHDNLQALNCPMTEAMMDDVYDVFVRYRDPTKGFQDV